MVVAFPREPLGIWHVVGLAAAVPANVVYSAQIGPHSEERHRVGMSVEDKLDVAAGNLAAAVLSPGMICRIAEQDTKRR
jgi:hypothetical protein